MTYCNFILDVGEINMFQRVPSGIGLDSLSNKFIPKLLFLVRHVINPEL